jgi:hypothetical protein
MKKAVVFLLAMFIVLQLGITAMAVTPTPEIVVSSTQSSQSGIGIQEIRHEVPFTGSYQTANKVYTNKAEVFTTNYTWYKRCELDDLGYWNDSQYSATVQFSDWQMRRAAGFCYTDITWRESQQATLRIWI